MQAKREYPPWPEIANIKDRLSYAEGLAIADDAYSQELAPTIRE
jgi:hypothetical protein